MAHRYKKDLPMADLLRKPSPRITKKRDCCGEHARGATGKQTTVWRIYVGGRPSGMWASFDRIMNEWDLGTETEHVMSAHSLGALMRRLELLAVWLQA